MLTSMAIVGKRMHLCVYWYIIADGCSGKDADQK